MGTEVNYEELAKTLDELKNKPKRKIKGFAKSLSYAIIIIAFLIGIGGSFEDVPFDMDAYVSFLPMFSALFIPLIVSIGVNSAVDKHEKAQIEKEKAKNGS